MYQMSAPPPTHTKQRVSLSGILIAFFVVSLPLTMFQVGALGSGQRVITVVLCFGALMLLYSSRTVITWVGGSTFWIAYATWTLATVGWAETVGAPLTVGLGMVLMLAALVLMAMLPVNEKDLKLIRSAWVILAIFCAALFLIFGEQAEYGSRTHLILASGGSDPNEFSAYFLLPLAYFVQATLEKRGLTRLLALIATLGAIYIVLMTGSRAGAIASLIVVVVVALRFAGHSIGRITLVATLSGVGAFLLGRFLLPLVPEQVQERLSIDALLDDSGSSRGGIWETGMELMRTSGWHLLFGYGPHGAPLDDRVMHNHFVQALVDGGLIGLSLFLAIIGYALYGAAHDKAVFAATLGVIVMFMTLTAYSNFRPAWAILFMALLAARQKHQRTVRQPSLLPLRPDLTRSRTSLVSPKRPPRTLGRRSTPEWES